MTDKARIVRLLKFLERNSDAGRLVTRADIAAYYESVGISGSPSTVRSDILALKEAEIELIELKEGRRLGGMRYSYGVDRSDIDARRIENVIDMMIEIGRLPEASRAETIEALTAVL